MTDIDKKFGTVTALSGASLDIVPGQVTALVGDNGAGKSTLVKILSGAMTHDDGSIEIEGRRAVITSPNSARRHGIHTVYQDLALANNLDVVENLFLGAELKRSAFGVQLPWLDRRAMEAQSVAALTRLGTTTIKRLTSEIGVLSGGQRQTVAIARALLEQAKLVILDEPTAALGVEQAAHVMEAIERLRGMGTSVLVVSHNLYEVFAVSDQIAVMRLGKVSKMFRTKETNHEVVVAAIMGASTEVPA